MPTISFAQISMTIQVSEMGSQKKYSVLITNFQIAGTILKLYYFSQVSNKNCKTIDEE